MYFSHQCDRFSLKSEWQQVSLGLQDSSDCSSQCCNLNDHNSSSDFLSHQSLFQSLGNCFSPANHYYLCHFHDPQIFHFSGNIQCSLDFFFFFFSPFLTRWCAGTAKSTRWQVLFFLLINSMTVLVGIGWSVWNSKSQIILWVSFSRTDSGSCIYHLLVWSNFNRLRYSRLITFPTHSCLVF